jgi:hypothetical protein
MVLWKRGANGIQGNQDRGLAGTSIFSRTVEDQTRLNQARDGMRLAFDELVVDQQITEVLLPLPPGRPEAFISGWSAICGALLSRLSWLVYDVQLGRITPEDALKDADALILSALSALRPGAILHPRPRRQVRYAQVSAFVQLSRYLDIVSWLTDYLSGLAQLARVASNGSSGLSPHAA